MKKVKKSVGLVLAILLVLTTALTGCSNKPANVKVDTSKFVTVSTYLIGDPAKDYDQMLTAFNAKAKADLNCELKVTWIGWGDYSTKYPLVLASGEPIDLIYTSNWTNFSVQAAKGAFMPLETLAPKYAPKSFAAQTAGNIKTCTINGHLDALSPKFSQYAMMGYIVRGDLMKKYGMTTIKSQDDLGTYFANVVKNDKALDPSGFDSQGNMSTYEWMQLGYYSPTGIYDFPLQLTTDSTGLPTSTIKNVLDDTAMPAFFAKMKDWSNAGYWPKNVLSNKDTNMLQEGIAATKFHNFDTWRTAYMQHPEMDLQFFQGGPHGYLTSSVQDAMAVPASSTNPERALMLLEKIRTDESYYDLLTYGIKDKDYTLNAQGELKVTDSTVFAAEGYCSWGFKDPSFLKVLVGSPPSMKTVLDSVKAIGLDTPYTNFAFNTDPVKAQVAAVASAMIQYHDPLALGYISDPVAGLATLKQQLKNAGIDAVQTELQKQIDTFNASLK